MNLEKQGVLCEKELQHLLLYFCPWLSPFQLFTL